MVTQVPAILTRIIDDYRHTDDGRIVVEVSIGEQMYEVYAIRAEMGSPWYVIEEVTVNGEPSKIPDEIEELSDGELAPCGMGGSMDTRVGQAVYEATEALALRGYRPTINLFDEDSLRQTGDYEPLNTDSEV